MHTGYFGLQDGVFTSNQDSKFFYPTSCYRTTIERFVTAIEMNIRVVTVTGLSGQGKTTTTREVASYLQKSDQINRCYYHLIQVGSAARSWQELRSDKAGPTAGELIEQITPIASKADQDRAHSMLILDEAQNLNRAALAGLTSLVTFEEETGGRLMVILVGPPQLQTRLLKSKLSAFENQNRVFHLEMEPLTLEETHAYIDHRVSLASYDKDLNPFSSAVKDRIFSFSGGIPRRINSVCDRALQLGFNKCSPELSLQLVECAGLDFLNAKVDEEDLLPGTSTAASTENGFAKTQPSPDAEDQSEPTSPAAEEPLPENEPPARDPEPAPEAVREQPVAAVAVSLALPNDLMAEAETVLDNMLARYGNELPRVIGITSARGQEGASTLVLAIAQIFAQREHVPSARDSDSSHPGEAGKSGAVLLDAHINAPSVHKAFGTDLSPGLSDIVRGIFPVHSVTRATATTGLSVVTAGTVDHTRTAAYDMNTVKKTLARLQETHGQVFVDLPPILDSVHAQNLSKLCGGIILVIRAAYTRVETIAHAVQIIRECNVNLLGSVLNRRTYPIPERLYLKT